jgi:glycosyltransferase involved in cell wall biosynthesis
VSVVVPAYNAAATIGEALESVWTQKPPPFEVIVSDDGSQDDLRAALRPFGQRVQVVGGPNAGLATARNRAAAVASGELLALLDADDVWLPGRLRALARAAAARPDLAVLTTDAIVVRPGSTCHERYYAHREFYVVDQELGILRNSFVFGAGAIRSDVFRMMGGYRSGARYAEDWDLWLRLLLRGHRAGLIDHPLYEYRRHDTSLTAHGLELSLGVLDVLRYARTLVSGRPQRTQLAVTTQEWRERAARLARRDANPHARVLALQAMTGAHASMRARLRLAGAVVLPPDVRLRHAGGR